MSLIDWFKNLFKKKEEHYQIQIDIQKQISVKEYSKMLKEKRYLFETTKGKLDLLSFPNKEKYINEQDLVDFIREYKDEIDWTYFCIHVPMTKKMMEEFREYLNWKYIIRDQEDIDDEIIERNAQFINFDELLWRRELSEDFIRKYEYKFGKSDF